MAVLGFDVDPAKVAALGAGRKLHQAPRRSARLTAACRRRSLGATSDFAGSAEPDAILICVPTPLTPQREPDMSFVVDTTRQIKRAPAARAARDPRVDAPTRARPTSSCAASSRRRASVRRRLLPRVLARARGSRATALHDRDHPEGGRRRRRGLRRPGPGPLRPRSSPAPSAVSSARTAEAVKLIENIFRAVNIALVNELKIVFDRMGIDVWEVLDAASTKPFGFMRFNPGPGLGRPLHPARPVLPRLEGARVRRRRRSSSSSRARSTCTCPTTWSRSSSSPSTSAARPCKGQPDPGPRTRLQEGHRRPAREPGLRGHRRAAPPRAPWSPTTTRTSPRAPRMRSWPDLPPLARSRSRRSPGRRSDAVVIVTDHSAVDYELVARHAPLVVDTRGVYRTPRPNVVKA